MSVGAQGAVRGWPRWFVEPSGLVPAGLRGPAYPQVPQWLLLQRLPLLLPLPLLLQQPQPLSPLPPLLQQPPLPPLHPLLQQPQSLPTLLSLSLLHLLPLHSHVCTPRFVRNPEHPMPPLRLEHLSMHGAHPGDNHIECMSCGVILADIV